MIREDKMQNNILIEITESQDSRIVQQINDKQHRDAMLSLAFVAAQWCEIGRVDRFIELRSRIIEETHLQNRGEK